jgi:hypothetical protein
MINRLPKDILIDNPLPIRDLAESLGRLNRRDVRRAMVKARST